MTFAATLAYFDHLGFELRPNAKFDLAYVEQLLAALGHPEQA